MGLSYLGLLSTKSSIIYSQLAVRSIWSCHLWGNWLFPLARSIRDAAGWKTWAWTCGLSCSGVATIRFSLWLWFWWVWIRGEYLSSDLCYQDWHYAGCPPKLTSVGLKIENIEGSNSPIQQSTRPHALSSQGLLLRAQKTITQSCNNYPYFP